MAGPGESSFVHGNGTATINYPQRPRYNSRTTSAPVPDPNMYGVHPQRSSQPQQQGEFPPVGNIYTDGPVPHLHSFAEQLSHQSQQQSQSTGSGNGWGIMQPDSTAPYPPAPQLDISSQQHGQPANLSYQAFLVQQQGEYFGTAIHPASSGSLAPGPGTADPVTDDYFVVASDGGLYAGVPTATYAGVPIATYAGVPTATFDGRQQDPFDARIDDWRKPLRGRALRDRHLRDRQ